MSDTITNALLFLITTVFDLYIFALIIRLVLVWVRANYFNPLTQVVVKVTDFLIRPLRKILPNIGHLETSTLVLILVLEIVKYLLISLLSMGIPNPLGLVFLTFGDSLKMLINVFFYAILLQVILSWIQPGSPVSRVLDQFTSPIMYPIQRVIPPVGGLDISPIPALILLQLLIIVIVNPLMATGVKVAFGG